MCNSNGLGKYSGLITQIARTDYIRFGAGFTENIGGLRRALNQNEATKLIKADNIGQQPD
jgi:hypothetical protein